MQLDIKQETCSIKNNLQDYSNKTVQEKRKQSIITIEHTQTKTQ